MTTAITPTPAPDVYVLVYSHRHGTDVFAYATSELAHAGVAKIARDWWEEIKGCEGVPDSPDALSDDEATSMYFDNATDESWEVEGCTIQRA
jgi:hypothetical protein